MRKFYYFTKEENKDTKDLSSWYLNFILHWQNFPVCLFRICLDFPETMIKNSKSFGCFFLIQHKYKKIHISHDVKRPRATLERTVEEKRT